MCWQLNSRHTASSSYCFIYISCSVDLLAVELSHVWGAFVWVQRSESLVAYIWSEKTAFFVRTRCYMKQSRRIDHLASRPHTPAVVALILFAVRSVYVAQLTGRQKDVQ